MANSPTTVISSRENWRASFSMTNAAAPRFGNMDAETTRSFTRLAVIDRILFSGKYFLASSRFRY
jgi:hypothetical protein